MHTMNLNEKRKLYLAAPLFSDMERRFNSELANRLEQFFDVFLPQRDGGLMVTMISEGVQPAVAARTVFQMDIFAINECDALLIVLDGRAVDEGAAFELGFAHALGKPCYGLQTDVRRLLTTGNNPMIDCSIRQVFREVDELVSWAGRFALAESAVSLIANTRQASSEVA